ncbi:PREDICTED: testis development-related protein [Poecilia mexicana]|uniref:Testis development-related protein n=1 Tax=Poecilia mexicana TaxID=48701 RepID=A0A3B3WDD0_9TELE|nr:PREDICTED: testis development-related protein [Poecilia formosa]XP_007553892.1 PREDICTED: testis development-related protein [Poecilia formosa]XP_007553894.1 PREDICTED: testis development-related protein [Poecilia formosa]XP_014840455.1 PREDICTED: testis development-related protein [Poecilia mexicana]XP_014840463.1 PREDICTED: testis development-related protein [Poecilia mexicana]XP_014840469.1 PREDICTED: testis development-related protein [Poecilia mexicana]
MNPMWKVYKGKVMKTLNPEYEEDTAEEVTEVEHDMSPIQEDEGPNAVSQLARKMQGAGAKSWNRFSSLFNKEDEHQLLEETECPPVADHPLAAKPEEPPRPTRRSGFWDSFATNFAAKKQAEAAAAAAAAANEGVAESGEEGATQAAGEEQQVGLAEETEAGSSSNNSFSKYVTLGGSGEDASFKWNFVTSKLAELKTKGMVNKTN